MNFNTIWWWLAIVAYFFWATLYTPLHRDGECVCVCVWQLSGRDARCVFQELQTADHYTEFRSVAEPRWYMAFSRRGRQLPADRWDQPPSERPLRHGRRRRRRRRRRHAGHICRQFIKTKVTPINDRNHIHDDHVSSSLSTLVNHQNVDFQRIYFRLRARDRETPSTHRNTTLV